MGKMGVKKKLQEKKGSPVVAAKAESFEGKSAKDEIDAIFGKKKRKATTVENQEIPSADEEEGTHSGRPTPNEKKKKGRKMATSPVDEEGRKKKKKLGRESKDDKIGGGKSSSSTERMEKPRKKTADGLNIYAEDELKWNSKSAGGTPQCPFDCECCF